jgi:uncharacterized protein DUF5684
MHSFVLLDDTTGSTSTLISLVIFLVILLFYLVATWRIFTKAGKPGWAVIIPIYSTIVMLGIVGRPWWWLLLLLIPFVNIVIGIIIINDLSKSFGHGLGYTLGLLFLSIIFIPVLGYGGSRYVGPTAA